MPPVRNYSNWNQRSSDEQEQVEPYQKFFFICEGANTEVFYFKKLIDIRKQLGIHPFIDICLLEKTEEDRDLSNPKRLLDFAEEQKRKDELAFDFERDRMIVVFDADIYKKKPNQYLEVLEKAHQYNDIVAVTNPAFELFLLLHYENTYENDICPNTTEILENQKKGKKRFVEWLFWKKSGMNSKENPAVGDLAQFVEVAITQEQKLNQDVEQCIGNLTCNVGKVIDDIRKTNAPIVGLDHPPDSEKIV